MFLAVFAVAGFAALKLIKDRPVAVLVWFVGAAVAHDFVLVPLYTAADRVLRARRQTGRPAPWLNYVRFPALISALLLLVFLPSIARLSDIYTLTTGLSSSGYLPRWALVSATLFAISGLLYAARAMRHARHRRRGSQAPDSA
jgi:hypothetical protein